VKTGPLAMLLLAFTTASATSRGELDELIARAKSFELDTPYVPPPGDPLAYHAAGYVKVMCSAVFMTGLAPDFAAENVGFFTAPYEVRSKLGRPVIDRANRAVQHVAEWDYTDSQISRQPRVRDAAAGRKHGPFHAGSG
jgi:hypothetical protein